MTDPTTEALNAAKREFWERMSFTDADTIDQMNFSRILDTIEAQARAAGREEERERAIRAFVAYLRHVAGDRDSVVLTGLNGDLESVILAILDAPAEEE